MEIIAITVCVNYSDILEFMLKQNIKFLKKWFIVTTKSDTKTIQLLENYNEIIHILIYDDFYINNYKFNKGGAIKFAQDYIDINFTDSNILILDSDIYLPDNFMYCLPKNLEPHKLYGSFERDDLWTIVDFIENTNPHKYIYGNSFVGFFQLYKQNSIYKYEESYNCASCDNTFRDKFNTRECLKISVKHLGKDTVNWNGRTYVL
jgi:hypothetical protein